jgi:glycerol kinase
MAPEAALLLAIDQGTHATRARVLDLQGRIVAHGEQAIALARPQPDWAEQDGDEIVASVHTAIAQAADSLGPRVRGIAAAGLSSQRASCICWDRDTGTPLSPVFSWQDRRMHAWIDSLREHGDDVHRRTGLYLSPHYGASKLRWALDHLPAVAGALDDGRLAYGPLASFLAFRLLKERPLAVDPQCAARTQLWNLHTRDWDPDLLRLFGLPRAPLPASALTCQNWGTLAGSGIEVPLTAVNGDQSAAVFAFGWPEEDAAYVNIGTSAFVQRALLRPPGHVPRQLTGIILADGSTTVYMVEGNVNGAGAGLEWLAAELGRDDLIERLPEWLARPPPDSLFLNGIAGLGGPFWQARFESRFVGNDAAEPWQKAVSVVESIAFLLQANIEHMAPYVPPLARIRVSGGVSRLDALCLKLASLNAAPVHRRDDPEASARGIAYLAAGRPAQWHAAAEEVFAPQPDLALRRRYHRWRALMAQATGVQRERQSTPSNCAPRMQNI